MWILGTLQLCFMITFTAGVTVWNCGRTFGQSRITGGKEMLEGEFPWLVGIKIKKNSTSWTFCGGSILNNRWIVTAAHCIENNDVQAYEVYVELHDFSKASERVKLHSVAKIFKHENYDNITFFNDIGLIKTIDEIDFFGSEGQVTGICLPYRQEEIPTSWATVAGWGKTHKYGNISSILLEVTVNIINTNICNKIYAGSNNHGRISKDMICAGNADSGACKGDSGGPLLAWKNGRAFLYGIVSFGVECGHETHPGVYTKVSSYIDWIENTIISDTLSTLEF